MWGLNRVSACTRSGRGDDAECVCACVCKNEHAECICVHACVSMHAFVSECVGVCMCASVSACQPVSRRECECESACAPSVPCRGLHLWHLLSLPHLSLPPSTPFHSGPPTRPGLWVLVSCPGPGRSLVPGPHRLQPHGPLQPQACNTGCCCCERGQCVPRGPQGRLAWRGARPRPCVGQLACWARRPVGLPPP